MTAVLLKEDWKKIDIFISVSNGNYIVGLLTMNGIS